MKKLFFLATSLSLVDKGRVNPAPFLRVPVERDHGFRSKMITFGRNG
jgi:hypothetical protein